MASKLKRTPEASIALSRELLENSTHVIVIAGAGMSADVGTPTYWTGDHAKYGDGTSRHGYTNLQHAMGPLWDKEPLNQAEFFQETFSEMLASPKPEDKENPYVLLKNWLDGREKKSFVITSNVDTAFKEYGYDSAALYEIHGAYDRSQCLRVPSKHGVFPTVDPSQDKTYCPRCDSLARPNVLFFDDLDFN